MSADNGIYILHTKDGYRVAEAQAIDNIFYKAQERFDCEFNLYYLYHYFCDCKVFLTQQDALKEADRLYSDIMNPEEGYGILEYGISTFDAQEIEFPKEEPKCCLKQQLSKIQEDCYSDKYQECENCGERNSIGE